MFSRTEILIGQNIQKLHNAKIIVFGIGGVGGYATEMLTRAGIQNITLVDFDVVSISNKNRQIIALDSTTGKLKTNVMRDRILDYNPSCNINVINKKLTPENIDSFDLEKYDYVVDCVDMVSSKVALIEYAKLKNIPIISAMGAGNRIGIPSLKVCDIYKTYNDGLAKVLRKLLKEKGIKSHNVVFCENTTISNTSGTIGSISYYPAMMGCMLSAFVIDDLIKGE